MTYRKEYIAGTKFHKLTIIKEVDINKRMFLCQCECGNTHIGNIYNIKRGYIKSCGCLQGLNVKTHGLGHTRINNIYHGIKQRCNNPNINNYNLYGGRGIKCEWNSFEEFYKDMGETYKEGLSIDRIDNNGNYCKENCRWTTQKEQNRNYSKNVNITNNGKTQCLKDWCEELGLNYKNIHSIHKRKGTDYNKLLFN